MRNDKTARSRMVLTWRYGVFARRFNWHCLNTGIPAHSFTGDELMYFKMTRAAVTVAGGATALCLGSVPAALAAPAQDTYFVPCNPHALYLAISHQSYGETLDLAPGCTYYLPGRLPDIKTNLTIVGYHSTVTRTRDAGSFSLLTVGGGCGDLGVINANSDDGDCKRELTEI